jgi:hypothetical protein
VVVPDEVITLLGAKNNPVEVLENGNEVWDVMAGRQKKYPITGLLFGQSLQEQTTCNEPDHSICV